jgi:hypothetical protein
MIRSEISESTIDWVERVHAIVDELVAPVAAAHGARLQCRPGCHGCCADGLSVFALEAAVIERHYATLLATDAPNAEGACAFLDESGACRIYAHRPYVCRTQGLPLRWLDRDADGTPTEVRDVCPLNAPGDPLIEELSVEECWTLGPFEERLAARQSSADGGTGERVALRDLFPSTPSRRRLPIARS